jgi:hypothetical protein
MVIGAIVYILCLMSSGICAALLVRSYLRHKTPLLLWSGTCFVFLALNNLVVVLDLLIIPEVDLSIVRTAASLVGISILLFGFIWETDR